MKTVAVDAFRTQGRGGKGVRGGKLRDEDYVEHLLTTTAHSYLLFFSNRGRVYRLRAHEIPMKERTARGTALVNLVALQPDEHIEAIIDTRTYEDGAYLFFATRNGMVKKTRMSASTTRRCAAGSSRSTSTTATSWCGSSRPPATTTSSWCRATGMTIRFSEDDVRPMGRATAGVRGMKLKSDRRRVVSAATSPATTRVLLFVSSSGHGKRTQLAAFNRQGRGGQGVRGHAGHRSRGGVVVAAFMVAPDDEILVFSSAGNIIRMGVDEISEQGRDATGVRVARLDEGDTRCRRGAGARSRRGGGGLVGMEPAPVATAPPKTQAAAEERISAVDLARDRTRAGPARSRCEVRASTSGRC